METPSRDNLIAAAIRATDHACAPYSGLRVGAALATSSGKVITGANVESVSYGLTCCAERIALFKALTDGERDFEAMALVSPASPAFTPCGACRQLLVEYAANAVLWCADSRNPSVIKSFTVKELMPEALISLPNHSKSS